MGGAAGLLASTLVEPVQHVEAKIAVRDASDQWVREAFKQSRNKPSLDNLIQALDLAKTEDFAVNSPTIVNVVADVLAGEVTTVTEAEEALRRRLLASTSIRFDQDSHTVSFDAAASDPLLATAIVDRMREDFTRALIREAASSPDPRRDALQKAAAGARAALTQFLARYDEAGLARLHRLQDDLVNVETELAAAAARLADLTEKQRAVSAMSVADVLDASLPDSLDYTGLEYERERYLAAQGALVQLASDLGPRHPRHIAAQAAVDDARQGIAQALRQLNSTLQSQLKAAEVAVSDTASRKQAARADGDAVEAARQLVFLQKAAEEARRNRDAVEHASASPAPVKLPTVVVVRPATAASVDQPFSGPAMLGGLGVASGLFAGIALADYRRRKQAKLAEALEQQDIELELPEQAAENDGQQIAEIEIEAVILDEVTDAGDLEPMVDDQWRPANDTSFGDRMRALLMDNKRPADNADLPPLVATSVAMARAAEAAASVERSALGEDHEIEQIWRQIEALRQIVDLQERAGDAGDIDQTACISRSAAA